MKKLLGGIFTIVCTILITSCSSDKSPPQYKPGGVVVSYSTDKQLNLYDSSAHSVMLIVYQLDNINAFHQLTKNSSGVQKLLNASKFDNSVLGFDTIFVNPNESSVVNLDRLQNAQWVGVVAGFYNLNAGQVTQEFEIKNAKKELRINLQLTSDSLKEVTVK